MATNGISLDSDRIYAQGGLITSTGSISNGSFAFQSASTVSTTASARTVELIGGWIGQIVVGNQIVWESNRTWRTQDKAITRTRERILRKFSAVFA